MSFDRRHPSYAKPQLLAEGPNQVWSWDITKLKGPRKWQFYSLYVVLDIFSRLVVGWLVAERESKALAKRLLEETCGKQAIEPGQLTIHADRGSPMKSLTVAQLLGELGVTKTHSRPHVSDDNPFSESHFKTLKYRPGFPERFGSIEHAITTCRELFAWYNNEHRHSGIGLLTPHAVHYGKAAAITERRRATLLEAYEAHPERFVRRAPRPPMPPTAVWINPPPPALDRLGLIDSEDDHRVEPLRAQQPSVGRAQSGQGSVRTSASELALDAASTAGHQSMRAQGRPALATDVPPSTATAAARSPPTTQ